MIRKKIAAILLKMHLGYGYQIYKEYLRVFGKIPIRNFYYNLNRGLSTGEFVVIKMKEEEGNFTWGNKVRRVYYIVGPMYELPNLSKEELEKLSKIKPNIINENKEKIREVYKEKIEAKLKKAIEEKNIKEAKKYEKILSKINNWPPTPLFHVEKTEENTE